MCNRCQITLTWQLFYWQRLPGFIHKDMETLFVEEQQAAISQLMGNLESQPVTKGLSDSKISMPFTRIKGWVAPWPWWSHSSPLFFNEKKWVFICWFYHQTPAHNLHGWSCCWWCGFSAIKVWCHVEFHYWGKKWMWCWQITERWISVHM